MQLNMSFIINFFKRLGFGKNKAVESEEKAPDPVKRSLPPTPINPMLDEVQNANTVTHDLIHEIEKNKHIQEERDNAAEAKVAVTPQVEEKSPPVEKPATVQPATIEPKVEKTLAPETKSQAIPKAKPAKEMKTQPAPKTKVESTPKVETAPKVEVNVEAKAKKEPKPKTTAKTETTTQPTTKSKSKTTTKRVTAPTQIVLDEENSSLTIKNKRVVGHCSKKPASFIVTHIVKPDQDKLRLNLALTNINSDEGLSFVNYDIANDAIVFSKKCDDKIAAKLNDVLLAWGREVYKTYY